MQQQLDWPRIRIRTTVENGCSRLNKVEGLASRVSCGEQGARMVKFSSKHAARSLRCPRLDSWRRHQPPAEDSLGFLGDEMVMAVCVCTPFASHVSIRAVCRRLDELITSEEFRAHRLESGWAEHGVVIAGGFRVSDGDDAMWDVAAERTPECWLLASGRCRPVAPLGRCRLHASSAVLDDEVWVRGGAVG